MSDEERIEGTDVCVCIHTALRKACDSPETSLLYNLIHMVSDLPVTMDPWRFFGAQIAEVLNKGKENRLTKPGLVIRNVAAQLDDSWFDTFHKLPHNADYDRCRVAAKTLYCALKLCDDGDFEAMAAYL